MKIDRLMSIIIYLLNHELVSARVLSERFGVTVRTIQRDLEVIELAGIPIFSIQGPNGGYGIISTYKMDRQLVTADDLFLIITSLKSVAASLEDESIGRTIEKIETLVPSGDRDFFSGRSDKLSIDFSMLGGNPGNRSSFKTVRSAVESTKLLRYSYTNSRLESSTRTVEPMTVCFRWRSWYLFAFCRERNDYRLFRISRIREPVVLHETFSRRPETFDSFTEKNDRRTGVESELIVLKFRPSMRLIVEESFGADELEQLPDGSLVVRTRMPVDNWVHGYILSWGEMVEVMEPEKLRCLMAESAEKIRLIYQ